MLEPYYNKVILIKRDSNTGAFPVKFAEFLRTPFFNRISPEIALLLKYNYTANVNKATFH